MFYISLPQTSMCECRFSLSIYLSIYFPLSIYLSVYLSLCLALFFPFPDLAFFPYNFSYCIFIYLFISFLHSLSFFLPLYLSFLFFLLFLTLIISLSLPFFLYLSRIFFLFRSICIHQINVKEPLINNSCPSTKYYNILTKEKRNLPPPNNCMYNSYMDQAISV